VIDLARQRYAFAALASAALFGASPPLAKLLLGHTTPLVLAGLLYLGSGVGLLGAWIVRRPSPFLGRGLGREGWPWLVGAVLCGGVLAPSALLWGIVGMDASAASLLLNAEALLTILVAAGFFGEHVGGRVWIAGVLVVTGGLALAWQPGTATPLSPRAGAVLLASLLWALDNNFTRRIAAIDATTLAMIKGLTAGGANLALGLAVGGALPGAAVVAGALALGAASYGASLVLFIVALRHLGSARTSAHFATSPFIGAALALALLGEPLTPLFGAAVALMAVATWLLLTEQHEHAHAHDPEAHDHSHAADEHHQHPHGGDTPGPHAHPHEHAPLAHAHPHLPDLHHRHPH
jgi:drug/metabolite transporter (DMT)-like permease